MEYMVCIDDIWYELNDEMIEARVTNYNKKYQGEIIIPNVVMYEDEEYTVDVVALHQLW